MGLVYVPIKRVRDRKYGMRNSVYYSNFYENEVNFSHITCTMFYPITDNNAYVETFRAISS